MSTKKIECDVPITSACIKELKTLYSDLSGVEINCSFQSTGEFSSEMQNTVVLLNTYKKELLTLIAKSEQFASAVLSGFQGSDTESSVPVNPKSSPVITPRENQRVTRDTDQTDSTDNSTSDTSDVESHFDYVWTGKSVDDEFKKKVVEISEKLDCDPDDLMAIMAFESGLDSTIVNKYGATGLIQIMPETASELGTSSEELRTMGNLKQLDYVYEHLRRKLGKSNGERRDLEDLYMAVLWPRGVGKSSDTVIFDPNSSEALVRNAYRANKGLDLNKDGVVTKGEACRMVMKCRDRYKRK